MDSTAEKSGKKTSANTYLTLFLSTFKISACTFGGGFVIIPLLRKKFVEELHWIEEEEMLDLTAIAQSSPGAIAVNASILIGYHVAGVPGALITILGTVLPPLTIISVISAFYKSFRDNIYVSMAMTGMLAAVAAVITDVVFNMAGDIFRRKDVAAVLMLVLAFIAVRYLKVNILIIILVSALVGAVRTLSKEKAEKERGF
ncbi:MAG: chromate transporter [Solobacterium sp.]|nr:chromate transporter [Solobacterium sp.]